MLIDKADVYIEICRSARLLSPTVHVRQALLLTTNRVGPFDDAFMSRVNIIIGYKNLVESRSALNSQFLDDLDNERDDFRVMRGAKDDYVLQDDMEMGERSPMVIIHNDLPIPSSIQASPGTISQPPIRKDFEQVH
ncbi:hypothetical protein QBC33DRAFT_623069 [Phialemonium atrogriseum]|uniref:Uncharacterized protein n=1 Tax=Phialemonium atrogriseum TaxID=1093897 RepID=A0AAJ0FDH1_9PEZI|nr:uncharacterized protein QBC33DRAFT_623069 [Phialemonium atrogriseum]KAK1763242.1 hypothetical protein QBC33DRAFT_623069 [Phialemonium atrogriseum]